MTAIRSVYDSKRTKRQVRDKVYFDAHRDCRIFYWTRSNISAIYDYSHFHYLLILSVVWKGTRKVQVNVEAVAVGERLLDRHYEQ